MAVAAYASVLSLMCTVDNVLHPSRRRLLQSTTPIEKLRESLGSLQDLLEKFPSKLSKDIEELARKIPKITRDVDDVIEVYVFARIHGGYAAYYQDGDRIDKDLFNSYCRNMDRFITKINSIKQKLMKKITKLDQKPKVDDYSVDETAGGSGDQYSTRSKFTFSQKIDRVIQKVNSITQRAMMKMTINDHTPNVPVRASPSKDSFNDKSAIIGLERPLIEIMEKLSGNQTSLQVIPIVGMPGIGKTTLARYSFDNKYIVENFTIRLWLTISQGYNVQHILEGLVTDGILGDRENEAIGENAGDLGLKLYQKLSGRKYLIVMDDVWTTNAWDDLGSFFPDNANGSRVIVTTRLSAVANSLGSRNIYFMNFLDEDHSWNLFTQRAFSRGGRSPILEEIGKKIARNCRGLPLTLSIIGGLLSNSDMTRAYWELVAENVNSFANSENDENCLKILSLSYDYLPIHLKPCFLYMAVFPEDDDVHVSKLVQLWIAEGYLKPVTDKMPEDVALEYLKDLIDRNMIEIRKRGSRGNIKTCGIHDLLRDLCGRELSKELLFCDPRVQDLVISYHQDPCSFCGDEGKHKSMNLTVFNHFLPPSTSSFQSLICNRCRETFPELYRIGLVSMIDTIDGVPSQILINTKSRYVRISHIQVPIEFIAPSPITLLWNLQTLDILTVFDSPIPFSGIWEMPQLRNLKLGNRKLSDPTILDNQEETSRNSFTILENLRTLIRVSDFRCTEDVVKRIPNVKKLGLSYNEMSIVGSSEVSNMSYYHLDNLHLLHNLEALSLRLKHVSFKMEYIEFPQSLKKLSLTECKFSWEDINTLGLLPNLEVLKLQEPVWFGLEWHPVEERFLKLKHLQLKSSLLIQWTADETHFPVLENLILVKLPLLRNIPSGFGNIDTLTSITLDEVRDSAIESAMEMIDEQQGNGNESLRLYVWNKDDRTYQQFGGGAS